MKPELRGNTVFDTSVLVEIILNDEAGALLHEALIDGSIVGYTNEVSLAELSYILCRKLGKEPSRSRVQDFVDSGYVEVRSVSGLIRLAAEYKCERSISLADCFSLALAKSLNCQALFATREKEFEKEMKTKPFDVKVIFLEDEK